MATTVTTAIEISCPTCERTAYKLCVDTLGQIIYTTHSERIDAAIIMSRAMVGPEGSTSDHPHAQPSGEPELSDEMVAQLI